MELQVESILSDLECPVCRDYLYPAILQCHLGHSICEFCSDKVYDCPICKSDMEIEIRNFTLESILLKLKLPCKNRNAGCEVAEVASKIREHQEFCEHGEILCPLSISCKCSWMGKLEDLLEHARIAHKSNADSVGRLIDLDLEGETRIVGLIDAYTKTFKYTVSINVKTNIIQVCVQFVGPRTDAKNYSFIVTCSNTRAHCIIKSTCQPLLLQETENKNFFLWAKSVNVAELKELSVSNRGIHFQIGIVLTKDCFAHKRGTTSEENRESDGKCKKLKSDNSCTESRKQ